MSLQKERNGKLEWLLRERGISQEKLARAICSSRPHVCQVMANRPGRGGQTRRKLCALKLDDVPGVAIIDGLSFTEAPALSDRILSELGWNRSGEIVAPRRTFQKAGGVL